MLVYLVLTSPKNKNIISSNEVQAGSKWMPRNLSRGGKVGAFRYIRVTELLSFEKKVIL